MATSAIDLTKYRKALPDIDTIKCRGSVVRAIGLTIEAQGLSSRLGELCHIWPRDNRGPLPCEVVGFRNGHTLLMPLGSMDGIQPGSVVAASGSPFSIKVGDGVLGRVIDGLGMPMDRNGPLENVKRRPISSSAPDPLTRLRIETPLVTGIRAVDAVLTCGKGQRMGIFAGSGVGKSTMIGMIARNALADVNVIALIGERGREVQDFIDNCLGEEGLKRSVVVVSTSDQPALVRLKGAWVATTIAEYFRDRGLDVVFLMDSVTRFAMAQREVGLAVGEPPALKGYTPSVFALLPRLMERTGTSDKGAITGFYTVLVESDDLTEPITDTVRSILDGHIVLSRELASQGHFPAVDVLNSVSRVMPQVTTPEHRALAARLREALATYYNARDIINIGAYVSGSNPQIDAALEVMPRITEFLRQAIDERSDMETTLRRLESVFAG
ncbi:MAG: FliI/YscN family ATPase [Chloroflexota bacterium]